MSKQIELYPEDAPYSLSSTATVRAYVTRRGDVEISRDWGDNQKILTVIPKAKRAELAQFLANAE